MKPIPSLAGEGLGNKNDGRDRSYSPLRSPSNPTASVAFHGRRSINAQDGAAVVCSIALQYGALLEGHVDRETALLDLKAVTGWEELLDA